MTAQMTLADWAPPLNPALSQWHTPGHLARHMVEWAGVQDCDTVLEPSVGGGSIARAVLACGASVFGFEIDIAWAHALKQDAAPGHLVVTVADFLTVPPVPDLCNVAVMNPPLDGGVGPAHVWRALQWCPRVVSVLRTVDLHGVERHATLWSKAHLAGIAWQIRRPKFGGAGAQEDFVVVDVRRDPPADGPRLEWW